MTKKLLFFLFRISCIIINLYLVSLYYIDVHAENDLVFFYQSILHEYRFVYFHLQLIVYFCRKGYVKIKLLWVSN